MARPRRRIVQYEVNCPDKFFCNYLHRWSFIADPAIEGNSWQKPGHLTFRGQEAWTMVHVSSMQFQMGGYQWNIQSLSRFNALTIFPVWEGDAMTVGNVFGAVSSIPAPTLLRGDQNLSTFHSLGLKAMEVGRLLFSYSCWWQQQGLWCLTFPAAGSGSCGGGPLFSLVGQVTSHHTPCLLLPPLLLLLLEIRGWRWLEASSCPVRRERG